MTTIAQPSVQSLIIEMRFNGQSLSSGTAFVVNGRTGPLLITNRHNVTGRHQETDQPLSKTGGIPNEIVVVHNSKRALGEWVGIVEPILDADDNPRWIEHPVLGKKADFVALPLTNLQGVELYAYDLNNTGPADSVSVVGFPFGIQAGGSLAVWATGFMASEPEVNFKNLPTFLIDCRSRQGQSGSAVIAYRSGGSVAMKDGNTAIFAGPVTKFLGVYSGRINSESDLGIVWKASAIKELVDSI
ncbi:serine protease [Vibrio vulnificus]|nr:serine protease [Vibrio vulnificus]MCU8540445.1 serine protease [Vibrio vulnificus]MCU8545050.1 serine protease [Vibrio vulnificus]